MNQPKISVLQTSKYLCQLILNDRYKTIRLTVFDLVLFFCNCSMKKLVGFFLCSYFTYYLEGSKERFKTAKDIMTGLEVFSKLFRSLVSVHLNE